MAVVHSETKWGSHADGALHESRASVIAARTNRDVETPTLEISVGLAEARGLLVVAVSTDQELRSVLSEVLPKDGVLFLDTPEQLLNRRMPDNCAVLIVEQSLIGSTFERLKSRLKESAPSLVVIMTGTGENSSSLVSRLAAGHIDRFIVKPFKLIPTKSALRSALQQHRTLNQCAQVERSALHDEPAVELVASEKITADPSEKIRENSRSPNKVMKQSPITKENSQDTPQSVPQLTPLTTPPVATSRRFSLSPWAIALAAAITALAIAVPYLIGKENRAPPSTQTLSSSFNMEKVIAGHLAAAHRAFELGSYVEPAGLSAEHFYLAALELDPANVEARRGMDAVIERLIADTKQRIDSGDLLRAQSTLDNVRRIQPNHRELADVTTSLLNAREAERAMLQAARAATREIAEPIQSTPAKLASIAPHVVAKSSANTESNKVKSLEEKRQVIAPAIALNSILKSNQAGAKSLERMKDEPSPQSVVTAAMPVAPAVTSARETNSTPIPVAKVEASPSPSIPSANAALPEPVLVKYVKPEYSAAERLAGSEGWLDVHFLLASDGKVIHPHFEKRSLTTGLRRATLEAVAQWRYSPVPGAPDRPMTVRVYFKLGDKKRAPLGTSRDLAS